MVNQVIAPTEREHDSKSAKSSLELYDLCLIRLITHPQPIGGPVNQELNEYENTLFELGKKYGVSVSEIFDESLPLMIKAGG